MMHQSYHQSLRATANTVREKGAILFHYIYKIRYDNQLLTFRLDVKSDIALMEKIEWRAYCVVSKDGSFEKAGEAAGSLASSSFIQNLLFSCREMLSESALEASFHSLWPTLLCL